MVSFFPILAFDGVLGYVVTIVSVITGVGGLAALFVGMYRASDTKRVVEILKEELQANKEQNGRLEKERNEYREKLHTANGDLQSAQLTMTELKLRTDFTPVFEFQKKWYQEQADINKGIIETLQQIAKAIGRPVLTDKVEKVADKVEAASDRL